MKVLADTPVWSLALRRQKQDLSRAEAHLKAVFSELINDGRILLIGPIRQELLSGIRDQAQFERLRELLRAFPDRQIATQDYERAAQMSNECRSQRVANTPTDMLICSVAYDSNAPIFTTDKDFERYSSFLPIRLFPRENF